jgi:hypothetical protein
MRCVMASSLHESSHNCKCPCKTGETGAPKPPQTTAEFRETTPSCKVQPLSDHGLLRRDRNGESNELFGSGNPSSRLWRSGRWRSGRPKRLGTPDDCSLICCRFHHCWSFVHASEICRTRAGTFSLWSCSFPRWIKTIDAS